MIPVTKPFLPPQSEYQKYLDDVWKRNWLTNNGPLVNDLELRLKKYLDVRHMLYLANGTLAIQLAIKGLNLHGEIITTPFSYVATTSSIVWEACRPVFVDIDPETFTIDVKKISAAVTNRTTAILATHVFGNSCDINAIEEIAGKHKLKVIYDAAHCFGTKYKSESIFKFGDVSTTSFHATKLFHTIEGGAVFTQSPDLLKRLAYMRNFGHDGPFKFNGVGINAKNSEFHAAMGLCNLRFVDDILNRRKEQSHYYDEKLKTVRAERMKIQTDCEFNYAYYPLVFESENLALRVNEALSQREIFVRRYFYPSLSTLDYIESSPTPVSDDIASRILCLPIYHELSIEEQDMISRIILRTQNN